MSANAINTEQLASLNGSNADQGTEAYTAIKNQLHKIRQSNSDYLFIYLVGYDAADDNIFFFVDSQISNSDNYAVPGLVYEEASQSFKQSLQSNHEAFVGPVTDRWGHHGKQR